ncbi:MAG: dihydrodipicolinate reductase C-terminal domain-containing protein [Ignavibacteria bacterium]|jgi:4-hydroxy-tetrahydrodipicolinate reductase
MKITLNGYGKMGKEIEKILLERKHTIETITHSSEQLNSLSPGNSVCIDFTNPDAFLKNYKIIADKFSGAVIGTTGWYKNLDKVKDYFISKKKKLVYGTNFSVGVNILFQLTDYASKLFSKFDYDSYIIELHHKEKKDSPSGTAETLKRILSENIKTGISVSSIRKGYIKGIHDIGFESSVDRINIRHEAYSRESFAFGAVLAAEWIEDVDGATDFKELFKQNLDT